MKIIIFQHGKDAHRDFEKGALNDSSRSLIWSFVEQIVFLKICEKVSKVSKLDPFFARTQCMHTPPRIQSKRRESAKFVMNHPEFCSESSRYQVNAIVRRGVNDACLAIGRGKRPCYLDCPVPYDEASGHWEPDGM